MARDPEPMDYKVVDFSVQRRSAVITLRRPERGNAWTGRMHAEYVHAVARAEADPSVRTMVVTGSGRAFCVGGDVEALSGHAERGSYDDGLIAATSPLPAAGDHDAGEPDDDGGAGTDRRFPGVDADPRFDQQMAFHFGLTKPVIAAINGSAAGIGLALACFADLRFAVPGAKLTTAHGKLGLPPEYGLSWLLPRHIGLTRAMDLLLTSRIVLTDEAFEMGLINRLVPGDELLDTVLDHAEQMATWCSPGALAASKRMVYLDQHRDIGRSVADSLVRLDAMMGGDEFRLGVRALRRKQSPEF